MNNPLDILYQDEHLVAAYRPEGLLVHKSNVDPHETRFLLQELRDQLGVYLYPIHRLDKPTSGLILFALSSEVAAAVQKQMEENNCSKEYLLICRGYTAENGIINHPLKPIDDFKSKRKKNDKPIEAKPAKDAITLFERLDTIELPVAVDRYPQSRYSFVKARILTGRKHQIRRHFKHLSHPIIGCPKYGKSVHNRYFAEQLGAPRLLLHSYRMTLTHPVTDAPLDITAAPSGSFKALMQDFNWAEP